MQFMGNLWGKVKEDYHLMILVVLIVLFFVWPVNSVGIVLFVFSFIYLMLLTRNMFITKDNSTLKRVLSLAGMLWAIDFLIDPIILAGLIAVIMFVISVLIGILMAANKKQSDGEFSEFIKK